MKNTVKLLVAVLMLAVAFCCVAYADEGEVIVLYTNDSHTYVNNDGLTFANVAGLRDALAAEGKNVLLVDAGDHAQGTAYGGMDNGKAVIDIMNAAGYDVSAIGNHEFDYGQFRFFGIVEQANYPYISCNFYNVADGTPVLDAYKVFELGGLKIAFVGVSTPETITKSTPVYFQNENGEYIYGFYSGENGEDLYASVQAAIDAAKAEADIIIGLGHLGVDLSSEPYRSTDVIANTVGFDAFIDGHSHTTIESQIVLDKEGNEVVLSQSGEYLKAIGKMTITADGITTELVTEVADVNEAVKALNDAHVSNIDTQLGEQIAVADSTLYINDPADGHRIVRNSETNLADLAADSYYYYFNKVLGLDCEIVLQNGGGVRAQVEPGAFTFNTAKTVAPFGNVACLVEISGQDILDCLEKGAMSIGLINEATGDNAESGGFGHVAGLKYSIKAEIPSTVAVDNDGLWLAGPTGEYKVHDVAVYNKETGAYEPLELDRKYRVAGINYMLRNSGDGMTMFADSECVLDYVLEDYLVIAAYAQAFAAGEDGYAHISTANSPLSDYAGYLMDYEAVHGAGRITID